MKVIVLDRQKGKTTQMIQWLREAPKGEHRVLVCHTGDEAMRLLRDNRAEFESWQFVSIDEVNVNDRGLWSGVLMGRGGRMVLGIDNLDMVLSRLVGWQVGAVSITPDK